MTPTMLGDMIWGAICWGGLLLLYFQWRQYRADALRDELFALRDQLHDYARAGHLSFECPGYRDLWLSLNAVIHFADRVTICRLVLPAMMDVPSHDPAVVSYKKWKDDINGIESADARRFVLEVHDEMTNLIVKHLLRRTILTSPLGFGIDILRRFGPDLPGWWLDIRGHLKKMARRLEVQAVIAEVNSRPFSRRRRAVAA